LAKEDAVDVSVASRTKGEVAGQGDVKTFESEAADVRVGVGVGASLGPVDVQTAIT